MLNAKSEVDSSVPVSEPRGDEELVQRRERLAQMIGRLLVEVWLERRRETENCAAAGSDWPMDGDLTTE